MLSGRLLFVFLSLILIVTSYGSTSGDFIDLTYPFHKDIPLYPGLTRATQTVEREGLREGGWYASRSLCISEHTGTHMDSPYHFYEKGRTLDQIPLEELIDVNGVVIDVYKKVFTGVEVHENYAFSRSDIIEWEKVHGQIPPRSVVLVRTGWGDQRWNNIARYLGLKGNTSTAGPSDGKASHPSDPGFVNPLNFPGVGESAANFLTAERQVLGVGIDALSIDTGASNDFVAHRILSERNAYILENVANSHLLPATGFRLWIAPFKIDRGTGAPVRLFARLNNRNKDNNSV